MGLGGLESKSSVLALELFSSPELRALFKVTQTKCPFAAILPFPKLQVPQGYGDWVEEVIGLKLQYLFVFFHHPHLVPFRLRWCCCSHTTTVKSGPENFLG